MACVNTCIRVLISQGSEDWQQFGPPTAPPFQLGDGTNNWCVAADAPPCNKSDCSVLVVVFLGAPPTRMHLRRCTGQCSQRVVLPGLHSETGCCTYVAAAGSARLPERSEASPCALTVTQWTTWLTPHASCAGRYEAHPENATGSAVTHGNALAVGDWKVQTRRLWPSTAWGAAVCECGKGRSAACKLTSGGTWCLPAWTDCEDWTRTRKRRGRLVRRAGARRCHGAVRDRLPRP